MTRQVQPHSYGADLACWLGIIIIAGALILALSSMMSMARDVGQFPQSTPEMRAWFNQLRSGKGMCCSYADGWSIEDADWNVDGAHYNVRVEGNWYVVPDEALVLVPNKLGRAIVWPTKAIGKPITIRCFLPSSLS